MGDIDLAEYDQMDEAKYFIRATGSQLQQQQQQAVAGQNGTGQDDLLTTLSSDRPSSAELANCENDYVFLNSPNLTTTSRPDILPTTSSSSSTTNTTRQQVTNDKSSEAEAGDAQQPLTTGAKIITPDQLDIRSHRPTFSLASITATPVSGSLVANNTYTSLSMLKEQNSLLARQGNKPSDLMHTNHNHHHHHQHHRLTNPLMSINSNGNNNPFFTTSVSSQHQLQQVANLTRASEAAGCSVVTSQPFYMRTENFASSKPIGLQEGAAVASLSSASAAANSSHLSDLMHQIITKSDSIHIAIPCLFCSAIKSCPPSDISDWLSHMNRTHNCKLCPICSKLVGLGPKRDIEIMRQHVVAHIDNDWLERRTVKTNFTYGLQQQWFPSDRCTVRVAPSSCLNK